MRAFWWYYDFNLRNHESFYWYFTWFDIRQTKDFWIQLFGNWKASSIITAIQQNLNIKLNFTLFWRNCKSVNYKCGQRLRLTECKLSECQLWSTYIFNLAFLFYKFKLNFFDFGAVFNYVGINCKSPISWFNKELRYTKYDFLFIISYTC